MQPSNTTPIVRAIDVGYGNVKYIVNRMPTAIQCELFPALAPLAVEDVSGGLLDTGRVHNVMVNGTRYAVGPDAAKIRGGLQDGRTSKNEYSQSDQYRALVYGALMSMRVTEIDVLVLGLPLSTYAAYKDWLATTFAGTHVLDGQERVVKIHKVQVVPQPLGGFYDFSISQGVFVAMRDETTLIVDPGYCTLDWLVAEGTTPVAARSDAEAHGGMGQVLRKVLEQVASDAKCSIAELGSADRIDAALRNGKPVRVFGQQMPRDVSAYLAIAKKAAEAPMEKLLARVGRVADIDNIVLVGGGAHVYRDLLAKQFPRHEIRVVADGVTSNVRGFQLLGELLVAKQRQTAAAAA